MISLETDLENKFTCCQRVGKVVTLYPENVLKLSDDMSTSAVVFSPKGLKTEPDLPSEIEANWNPGFACNQNLV